ncbi:MAG: MaoC like domain protein [Candidatus Accumulibacter regalis]|jgi:2-methylfumaryl-CoA hydratase|uniref:MaoC like domain protein n=2 Tax=Candidatus Accumulibacter TaxID=327159 RepID=A0A011P301_ACCRE|nr:MAG: MaoC like domain protein [Candidatus Accumulibacter regalis]MBL8367660.1 MaoC family dehydratase [Accumulibacter sp.]MBN8513774.1 MaoC family dehydratase [Accumulibacter sp.]MBO3702093.1 MaoC family dehydratase [Accumulibacter sp.]MQM33128.1 acyl dehydratase [Candidatus Accumulibacter phosphatis]
MMQAIRFRAQAELAGKVKVNLQQVRYPHYGRYLEEFVPGQVFVHPRAFTFFPAQMEAFARTYMQCNPLYLNDQYARSSGFAGLLASPQMVFNVVLSLGVQNDSEKAMANLGYYDAQYLRPVYPMDTIRSLTKVIERKERGAGKPGIVTIRTLGINQDDQVVLQYERKIMVAGQGDRPPTTPLPKATAMAAFPWVDEAEVALPDFPESFASGLTGPNSYFEDFAVGEIIVHANGRTITDEHLSLTYAVGNTHPLHFDRVFSSGLSGKMSGDPIVYGGLVFAWLEGLASRDVSENSVWELGFTEGYHTQPCIGGDTVAALSRVLAAEDAPGGLGSKLGIVTFQLIGVKNLSAANALAEYGEDLFGKENDKKAMDKEKIDAKIFEIERRLLIRKRG